MRILAVRPGPFFSVADVHRGWVNGLRELGHEVIDFNLDERLVFYERALIELGLPDDEITERAAVMSSHSIDSTVYEMWPDLILFTFGKFVAPFVYQIARARGIRTVLLATESPYEDALQLEMARHVDHVILNDPTNLDVFQRATDAHFLGHAYDPTLHHPGPAKPECRSDFCFVGTGYPSRIAFLEQVDFAGVDVALAGNWEHLDESSPLRKYVAHDLGDCLDNDDAADLYRGATVSANLYRLEGERSDGWAAGPREIELAACGTFFLRQARPESDELFPMLPTFSSPDDFTEKLRWYLAHDSERIAAAHGARAAVQHRTFTHNAKQLIERLT